MKKMTGSEIRQLWLNFFHERGHEIIPSASLVPHNDPTLLWINAGVAPLKRFFDGREKPNNPRMTNAQKSIRTNDIENVGLTARHHTFFEMLGNFSIGDYFRNEALEWAYDILTNEKYFSLPIDKLYFTYHPSDQDTHQKWLSLGVQEDHLIPLEHNFWQIGEGPCGPNTEVFFDRGSKYDPDGIGIRLLTEELENDRYIEIWGIVFSQYNAKNGIPREQYEELPSKNIDTGMGLERMACILQEVETNYDTDLFAPMIKFIEDYAKIKYTGQMAFRVIVDHIRSVTFAISDGAMLSNEGRGYVLRRILRRAVRYGRKLGLNEPFLYKMVDVVVDKMADYYPYLLEKKDMVSKIIKKEEENFLKTLDNGEKRLLDIISNTNSKVVTAEDAFLLYDTFGFPLELTQEIAQEQGLMVDVEGYNHLLALQKERARKARGVEQSMNIQNEDYLQFSEESLFIGYEKLQCHSTVVGVFEDGEARMSGDENLVIVTKETPFYAESGGQVGDIGQITIGKNSISVINTFKLPNGQHAHQLEHKTLNISLGDEVTLSVNPEYRFSIAKNHSATHLLNQSLRNVLGSHVVQQGSWVGEKRMRFDFNHWQSPTNAEIVLIEQMVNQAIKANYPVITTIMALDDAKKTNAQAVFGEKYGDKVRVVDMDYARELCGGTHVESTGAIENFAILSVETKGSGVFRIEGTTSSHIKPELIETLQNIINDNSIIKAKIADVISKAQSEKIDVKPREVVEPTFEPSYQYLLAMRNYNNDLHLVLKELEKSFENSYHSQKSADYKSLLDQAQYVDGVLFLIRSVNDYDLNVLKEIIDKITASLNQAFVFFANCSTSENKIVFIAKAKNVTFHAGMLVKEAATLTGGNGGGRPDFAQAGGRDLSKVDEAIALIRNKCGL